MAQPPPKNDLQVREYDRQREKAKKFRTEVISLVILDEEGKVIEGCSWKIRRDKLTPEYLQLLIDHSPNPVKMDYLRDPTGEIIWPADMQLRCRPKPIRYQIVDREVVEAEDAGDDPRYQGELAIVLTNVPLKSDNGEMVVREEDIKTWLLGGVLEDYQPAIEIEDKIKKLKGVIVEQEKKIQRVGYQVPLNSQGKEIKGEQADRLRQEEYQRLVDDKEDLITRQKQFEEDLQDIKDGMSEQGVRIELYDEDEIKQTATYLCRFTDPDFGQDLSDTVIAKQDWKGLRMALPYGDLLDGWVGRGPYPTGETPEWPDMSQTGADMKAVRVARLQHGFGTYRMVESKKLDIAGPYFEFYHGQWRQGQRHGYGILYSDEGVYAGNFHKDMRWGDHATMDYATGDCHRGSFGCPFLHQDTKLGANPYAEGVPDGEASRVFADGATFTGQFVNGCISGQGRYVSALGDVYEGEFKDGLYHGQGKMKTSDGQIFEGTWKNGRLDGPGMFHNGRAMTYTGHFFRGEKHGKGKEKSKGSLFEGFFKDGMRNGRGCMLCPTSKNHKLADGVPVHLAKEGQKYEGRFVSGRTRGLGCTTDNRSENMWYTFNGEHHLYPYLSKLPLREERSRRAEQRSVEKRQRVDLYLRQKYEKRCRKIFKEQCKMAVRALRKDEEAPLDLFTVEARLRERESRIENEIKNWYRRGDVPKKFPQNIQESHAQNWLSGSMDRLYKLAENVNQDPYGTVLSNVLQSDFEQFEERRKFINRDFMHKKAKQKAEEEGPYEPSIEEDLRELLKHKATIVDADGIRKWDPNTNTINKK